MQKQSSKQVFMTESLRLKQVICRFSFPILVILSVIIFFKWKERDKGAFISFVASMKKADPNFERQTLNSKKNCAEWSLLEKLYAKHLFSAPATPTIPKIIHQIWLGGPLPEKYYALQRSWQEHHPDWEYRLWTDADLATFPLTDPQRFKKAENKAEQSDILRYEILYRYGGLYVDVDFKCLKPHDSLLNHCDFYVGLEAKLPKNKHPAIGNAIIASVPGHPIFKECLEGISKEETLGDPDTIQWVTGPQALCRAFFKLCDKGEYRNVAFPFTYFYPLPACYREQNESAWIQEESFAIHYFHGSWLKS